MRKRTKIVLTLCLATAHLAASPQPAPTASPAPTPAPSPSAEPSPSPAPKTPEPDRVVVQHILVSFGDKIPGKKIARTENEARVLAGQLLERARKGEDFDALVKQYTDDQHPGIYAMFNRGLRPRGRDEYPRQGMVACFGDLSFSLQPGGIGLCELDATRSPYGWHIIKRLE